MLSLPKVAEPLLSKFSIAFTKPTFQRAIGLLVCVVQQERSDLQRRAEQRASAAVGANSFFGGRSTRCPQKTPALITRDATKPANPRGVSGQKWRKSS